ncbi:MAG: DUF393 domain-containing protein [Bacteroidales bacterium]|nr:DUF393 domain-containing protein [Bacteroidales bacterium]
MNYVIYDGTCGFCNKSVMFVAKNDKKNYFKFVSNLSVFGNDLLSKHQILGLEDSTIILLEDNKLYIKSLALRRILLKLPNYKIAGLIMYLFPAMLSDYIYDFIAKHRKKIIKNTNCEIPDEEIRKKFIV